MENIGHGSVLAGVDAVSTEDRSRCELNVVNILPLVEPIMCNINLWPKLANRIYQGHTEVDGE